MVYIYVNSVKVEYVSLRIPEQAEFDTLSGSTGSVSHPKQAESHYMKESPYSIDSAPLAILEKAVKLVKDSKHTAQLKIIEKSASSPPEFFDAIKQGSVRLSFNIDNEPVWINLIVVSSNEKEYVDLTKVGSEMVIVHE